jgi:hypothetical protein
MISDELMNPASFPRAIVPEKASGKEFAVDEPFLCRQSSDLTCFEI